MFIIDKSRFEAEELEQYEALIAKAKVDPEANQEEMEDDMPPETTPKKKSTEKAEVQEMEETKKSAPAEQAAAAAALEAVKKELEELKKSVEMKGFTTMAQKYAPLGKKEDELAKTLYDMKKSNQANYDAFIAILDESLGIVEKSGVFAEIGKSSRGSSVAGGSAEDKIEAKAREIMKADPNMNYTDAVAKAWIENPDLAAEYDAEYCG